MNSAAALSKKSLAQYGLLAMPLAFAGMPIYIYAPDFYAGYGVPLSAIGIALLLLRCFDAVQDPIIGRLSDRFAQRRLSIIMLAGIFLVGSFFALFNPDGNHLILWFAISTLLATTAFSIISINLNTIGGLWSLDEFQKTRITTYREAFGLVGLLLAVTLPTVITNIAPESAEFNWVSLILAVIMAVALLIFSSWYKAQPAEKIAQASEAKQPSGLPLICTLKQLPASTKRFFVIYAISMFASSIPALLVIFYIRDLLNAEELTGLFLLLYFIAGICGMPLWQVASKRSGKINAWMMAMLLAVFSFIWAFFLGEGDLWQYGVICVLSGIAFGADLALPPSILADHIQQGKSENHAAIQFSLLTFLAKAALALASFIGLSTLDFVGFAAAGENSANALLTLSVLYALLPCIIKLSSVWLLHISKHSFASEGHNEKSISHTHPHSSDRSDSHV